MFFINEFKFNICYQFVKIRSNLYNLDRNHFKDSFCNLSVIKHEECLDNSDG